MVDPDPTEKRAKILEMMRRLRNLSSNNPSLAEAEAAAAKLQELAFKYAIELSEIDAAEERGTQFIRDDNTESNDLESYWQAPLINAICNYGFCKCVLTTGSWNWDTNKRHSYYTILGEKHNIEIAEYMFEYLCHSIGRLTVIRWIRYVAEEDLHGRACGKRAEAAWKTSFKRGASSTIIDRLKEQWFEMRRTVEGPTMALVVSKETELRNYLKSEFPSLSSWSINASAKYDEAGYSAGVAAGKSIQINRGLAGSGPAAQIRRLK